MLTYRFMLRSHDLAGTSRTCGTLRVLSLGVLTHLCVLCGAQSQKLPTLTHAEEIRRLNPEEAAKGYPVRIRGVVTMDAPAPDFFVQDATAGIYAEGSATPRFTHNLGDLVEVEGITGPESLRP